MNEKLERLKELAEEATPGPWVVHSEFPELNEIGKKTFATGRSDDWKDHTVVTGYEHPQTDAPVSITPLWTSDCYKQKWRVSLEKYNAEYIAAANPETIKELIAELEAKEAEVEALKRELEGIKTGDA